MTGEAIQIENGDFTRIHNSILKALAHAHLTGQEYVAVLFLLRKTYGWNKKEDAISLTQWAEGMGIKHSQKVIPVLAKLLTKKIIYRERKVGIIWVYGFNKYFEEWEGTPLQGSTLEGSTLQRSTLYEEGSTPQGTGTTPPQGTGTTPPQGTNKRQLKTIKDNLTKDNIVASIPENLSKSPEFLNEWQEWLNYKKEAKHKFTPTTQIKQLNLLGRFSPGVAIEMLEQAMLHGWQGVFELKDKKQYAKAQTNQRSIQTMNDREPDHASI